MKSCIRTSPGRRRAIGKRMFGALSRPRKPAGSGLNPWRDQPIRPEGLTGRAGSAPDLEALGRIIVVHTRTDRTIYALIAVSDAMQDRIPPIL